MKAHGLEVALHTWTCVELLQVLVAGSSTPSVAWSAALLVPGPVISVVDYDDATREVNSTQSYSITEPCGQSKKSDKVLLGFSIINCSLTVTESRFCDWLTVIESPSYNMGQTVLMNCGCTTKYFLAWHLLDYRRGFILRRKMWMMRLSQKIKVFKEEMECKMVCQILVFHHLMLCHNDPFWWIRLQLLTSSWFARLRLRTEVF